ncbi:MAG TPA: transcriptional repressor [Gammaproteobacteria bacterium]|nr:transcriptional repressor [Gammaproteobacteria bacterium]
MSSRPLAEQLRRLGIAPTPQRLRIAAVMLAAPRHFRAEEVLEEVNREPPGVSKATLYNSLRLFTARGLLREVIVDPERVLYDSTAQAHHHFYDPATGELTDIPAECLTVSGLPEPPPGTEAGEIEVLVRLRPAGC